MLILNLVFMFAALNSVCSFMVRDPADIFKDASPHDALMKSIERESIEGVRQALQDGADVNQISERSSGSLPLGRAATFGLTGIVETLLAAGADVNLKDRGGYTAMHHAAGNGHIATADALYQAGARLDIETPHHCTPHELAAFNQQSKAFEVLKQWARLQRAASHYRGRKHSSSEQSR